MGRMVGEWTAWGSDGRGMLGASHDAAPGGWFTRGQAEIVEGEGALVEERRGRSDQAALASGHQWRRR